MKETEILESILVVLLVVAGGMITNYYISPVENFVVDDKHISGFDKTNISTGTYYIDCDGDGKINTDFSVDNFDGDINKSDIADYCIDDLGGFGNPSNEFDGDEFKIYNNVNTGDSQ